MAEVQPTIFNIGQLHILDMLNRCNTEESLKSLKKVLFDYYSKQVEDEAARMWETGVISREKIEQWGKQHMRTPYVHA
ncbi:MAG: dephospho-CoA kinase [Prevotella sp.]|nr:dephospho-CoA kinase [Prevotella sp.]